MLSGRKLFNGNTPLVKCIREILIWKYYNSNLFHAVTISIPTRLQIEANGIPTCLYFDSLVSKGGGGGDLSIIVMNVL